ncbi:hypothetical protein CPC08DRAFT_648493, partial [Agrocybe pediades]
NAATPLAYLPEELALQVALSTYIIIGACAVMVWDFVCDVPAMVRLVMPAMLSYSTPAYILSRLGTLGYVLGTAIYHTSPVRHCFTLQRVVDWFYPLAVPFTALLFYFRIMVLYPINERVKIFFGIMWLAVLGGCLTVPQAGIGGNIGPTNYCQIVSVKNYGRSAAIIPLINDTFVYLAIAYRFLSNAHLDNIFQDGWRTFLFGDKLHTLSKAMLPSSSLFYSTTVLVNLLTVVMLFMTSLPAAYQTMFVVPNVVLMNIMGCHVYRNLKFSKHRDQSPASSFASPERSTVTAHRNPIPLVDLRRSGSRRGETDQGLQIALGEGNSRSRSSVWDISNQKTDSSQLIA